MPLYEYQCESCGNRFERIQKFSDPPVAICPTCGGPVQKLLSSPAIQFKGSGWYITDYAKKNDVPASKSSATEPSSKAGDAKDSSSGAAPAKDSASPASTDSKDK